MFKFTQLFLVQKKVTKEKQEQKLDEINRKQSKIADSNTYNSTNYK